MSLNKNWCITGSGSGSGSSSTVGKKRKSVDEFVASVRHAESSELGHGARFSLSVIVFSFHCRENLDVDRQQLQ